MKRGVLSVNVAKNGITADNYNEARDGVHANPAISAEKAQRAYERSNNRKGVAGRVMGGAVIEARKARERKAADDASFEKHASQYSATAQAAMKRKRDKRNEAKGKADMAKKRAENRAKHANLAAIKAERQSDAYKQAKKDDRAKRSQFQGAQMRQSGMTRF